MACYIIQMSGTDYYKIGFTKTSCRTRLSVLQVGNPIPLVLVQELETKYPVELEKLLHKKFEDKRIHGEWFCLSEEDLILILEKIV